MLGSHSVSRSVLHWYSKIHTVQQLSRWKILDKGKSGWTACGRKYSVISATLARSLCKGIVTHNDGGSRFCSFISSVIRRLFGRFDTCSANLWTTKLLPTPESVEVTRRTLKLQKESIRCHNFWKHKRGLIKHSCLINDFWIKSTHSAYKIIVQNVSFSQTHRLV